MEQEKPSMDSQLLKLEKDMGLEFIIRKSIEWTMGRALDYAKISEMSERSYKQLDRCLKDDSNRCITYTTNVLREMGFLKE